MGEWTKSLSIAWIELHWIYLVFESENHKNNDLLTTPLIRSGKRFNRTFGLHW